MRVSVCATTSVAFFGRAYKRDDPENLCLPRDWKLCAIILWLHTRSLTQTHSERNNIFVVPIHRKRKKIKQS